MSQLRFFESDVDSLFRNFIIICKYYNKLTQCFSSVNFIFGKNSCLQIHNTTLKSSVSIQLLFVITFLLILNLIVFSETTFGVKIC